MKLIFIRITGFLCHQSSKLFGQFFGAMMAFLFRIRKNPSMSPTREVKLPRAEFVEIPLLGEQRITCASGSVWITRDHDAADYLLRSGETFWAPHSHGVIVEGLRDAQLLIRAPETLQRDSRGHVEAAGSACSQGT